MKKTVETLLFEAKTAYQEENISKTMSLCRKVIRLDSKNITALTLLGNAYFLDEAYEDALGVYRQIE